MSEPVDIQDRVQLVLTLAKKVQVSACDIDGIARGKVMSVKKFKEILSSGFGFCSVIFAWDMLDKLYDIGMGRQDDEDSGYPDLLAKIDAKTLRFSPFQANVNDMPCFLIDFYNSADVKTGISSPYFKCPRSLLRRMIDRAEAKGFAPMAGMELEWYNFRETPQSLAQKKGVGLEALTSGMFGYSLTRPTVNQPFYDGIWNACAGYNIPVEIIHTETGPGVFEVALEYTHALEMADRAHLFKTTVKQVGLQHGVTPCFMAKPYANLPGCSGHLHISLAIGGKNAFIGKSASGLDVLSDTGKHFLAGILAGLPSMMAIYAPNINSYKRLVANFWAPLNVSFGIENRTTAVRIIGPPICSPSGTRLEVRVPGADANPYLALAAIIGCGMYGVENALTLPEDDVVIGEVPKDSQRPSLPNSLLEAVKVMSAPGSMARKVFGDTFVEYYCGTRRHEVSSFQRAITDWELTRYMETV